MHDEEKKHSMISLTPLSHTTDTTEQHIAKTVDPNDSPANDGKHITNNKQNSTTVKQESCCHLTAHDDSTEKMIAKQAEQSRSNTSIDINAANMLQEDTTIGTATTAAVETTELLDSFSPSYIRPCKSASSEQDISGTPQEFTYAPEKAFPLAGESTYTILAAWKRQPRWSHVHDSGSV